MEFIEGYLASYSSMFLKNEEASFPLRHAGFFLSNISCAIFCSLSPNPANRISSARRSLTCLRDWKNLVSILPIFSRIYFLAGRLWLMLHPFEFIDTIHLMSRTLYCSFVYQSICSFKRKVKKDLTTGTQRTSIIPHVERFIFKMR